MNVTQGEHGASQVLRFTGNPQTIPLACASCHDEDGPFLITSTDTGNQLLCENCADGDNA